MLLCGPTWVWTACSTSSRSLLRWRRLRLGACQADADLSRARTEPVVAQPRCCERLDVMHLTSLVRLAISIDVCLRESNAKEPYWRVHTVGHLDLRSLAHHLSHSGTVRSDAVYYSMVEGLDDMDATEPIPLRLEKEWRSYGMRAEGKPPAPAGATAWKRWRRKAYDQHPCSEEKAVAAERTACNLGCSALVG